MDGDELETFNDIGIGPQVVFPFNNLNIIMAYQMHSHDDVDDQIWIRAMHNFGGPKGQQEEVDRAWSDPRSEQQIVFDLLLWPLLRCSLV